MAEAIERKGLWSNEEEKGRELTIKTWYLYILNVIKLLRAL